MLKHLTVHFKVFRWKIGNNERTSSNFERDENYHYCNDRTKFINTNYIPMCLNDLPKAFRILWVKIFFLICLIRCKIKSILDQYLMLDIVPSKWNLRNTSVLWFGTRKCREFRFWFQTRNWKTFYQGFYF